MEFPGRTLRTGETDPQVVKALREKLVEAMAGSPEVGCLADGDPGVFGTGMTRVVRLFQARHVDSAGRPLVVDGKVGTLTWHALFDPPGSPPPPSAGPMPELLREVLAVARDAADRKVRETPRNSNRGSEVETYQKSTGAAPGTAWCCSFVYYCFEQAATRTDMKNPMPRTAGCVDHWNRAGRIAGVRFPAADAVADPALLRPGTIFVMDFGGGLGHTGLITEAYGGILKTIEGNTDASLGRDGGGVYALSRKVTEKIRGYIYYG